MSIFDSEIEQLDNIDTQVRQKSLFDTADFIQRYMPAEVWYNSFTEHNKKEITEVTDWDFSYHPIAMPNQFTPYITIVNTFYQIPSYRINEHTKDGYYYRDTYSLEGHTKLASLELVRKGSQYYICPNYVKWPIFIDSCGLDELPATIRFAKKNKKSKSPLTFIIRYDEYPNWIKDLPKGSIIYIIPKSYMTIEHYKGNGYSCDFTKMKEFDLFIEARGKKIII